MAGQKYTVDQWVEQYRKMPKNMKLNGGISREKIMAFLEENNFKAPEEYIRFMELTNGGSLFGGKVTIWEIPEDDAAQIPDWKSIKYMNQESVKSSMPDITGVFLFAGNYLGDYIGVCMEDKEFDIIYTSPDQGESWNFYTFTDWLEDMWEELL